MALVMNRHLVADRVPQMRAVELGPADGPYPFAWSRIWRFALTFDTEKYNAEAEHPIDGGALLKRIESAVATGASVTGTLSELRAALVTMYWRYGGIVSSAEGLAVVDALLDAIYARIGGGQQRPRADPGRREPGLGHFGANYGEGQHRFWFVARRELNRSDLFDSIAGLFLREVSSVFLVSALYLYPPGYGVEGDDRPRHTFMLLLEQRTNETDLAADPGPGVDIATEYGRLVRLAISEHADLTRPHWPEFDDAAPPIEPAPDVDALIAGTDGREWNYPPWVITPQDQKRWRLCTLYAEKVAGEDPESYADTVYFMSRSLYHGDMPTE